MGAPFPYKKLLQNKAVNLFALKLSTLLSTFFVPRPARARGCVFAPARADDLPRVDTWRARWLFLAMRHIFAAFLLATAASVPSAAQVFNTDTPHARRFADFLLENPVSVPIYGDFFSLSEPIFLSRSGAIITSVGNVHAGVNASDLVYDVIINWAGTEFSISICQEYMFQFDFLATSVVVAGEHGFGGIFGLQDYANNQCGDTSTNNAIKAWEPPSNFILIGLKGLMDDLNLNEVGTSLIKQLPNLSNEQKRLLAPSS